MYENDEVPSYGQNIPSYMPRGTNSTAIEHVC